MTAKERLHCLADELSEADAAAAVLLVEQHGGDPMLRALASAPIDDEPSDAVEDASANEAWAQYRLGNAVALSEIDA